MSVQVPEVVAVTAPPGPTGAVSTDNGPSTVNKSSILANLQSFNKGGSRVEPPVKAPEPVVAPVAKDTEPVKEVPVPKVESAAPDDDLNEFRAPAPKTPDPVEETTPETVEAFDEEKALARMPKGFRKAYEENKKTLAAKTRELEEIKSKNVNGHDLKELESLKAEKTDLENRLAAHDYRSSPQFQREFIAPWQKDMDRVVQDISEFTDKSGTPLKYQDFEPLLKLKLPQATEKAKDLFGDNYAMALNWRQTLLNHERATKEAIDNHKPNLQRIQAEQAAQETKLRGVYEQEYSRFAQELPDVFNFGDEYKEVHAKGRDEANIALFGKEGVDAQTQLRIAAKVAQKAAAFTPTLKRAQAAEARVKELETALAKVRGTGPNGGRGTEPDAPSVVPDTLQGRLSQGLRQFVGRK